MNRLVFYDLGDVVVLAEHARTHQYLLTQHGIPKEKSAGFYTNEEYKQYARGRINSSNFAKALQRNLDTEIGYEELQQAHDIHIYGIDAAVLELMHRTRAKSNSMGIVTNTCEWQERRIAELHDFRREIPEGLYFCSHELGKLKADEGFWDLIRKKTGREYPEMILIDNSLPNVESLRVLGGVGIHYHNPIQLEEELRMYTLI